MARAVGAAIGLRDVPDRSLVDDLIATLQGRSLLLVLDNCEHLVASVAALVDQLLRGCPDLRVLATSREPLSSAGETTWIVPSLTLPAPGEGTTLLDSALASESVQLLVERAATARPGFTATEQNAAALIEICRRLDGIPLAIELAAARVRAFSVEQIAARLDDRFRLLTTGPRTALPRQQTLRATIDWSFHLLAEPERLLLRRLAIFAGGWTIESAESVTAGDGIQPYAVLDLLAQLVDKSLIAADEHEGAVRYRLSETLRQYAIERLVESGESRTFRDRHLAHFTDLAEHLEPKLRGSEEREALTKLDSEHDNLRAALDWALADDSRRDAALRLSGALAWFWFLHSHHDEGWRWLERSLAGKGSLNARMKALHGAGYLVHHRHESALARTLLHESLTIARDLDDRWTIALTLHHLGRVAYFEGDAATAITLSNESLTVAEEVGDPWLIAWALHLRGIAAYISRDYATTRHYFERSLAIRRELGYQEGIGILVILLGLVAIREQDYARALAFFHEGLATAEALMVGWSFGMILANFSILATALGQHLPAIRLGAAAMALSEAAHTPLIPLADEPLRESLAVSRQVIGETAFAGEWAAGRRMPLADCVTEARSIEITERTKPARHPLAVLTPAEREVFRLLAVGKTTKEIAAELVVAVSTVDRHITHIYTKLDVRNRAEATALALRHRFS